MRYKINHDITLIKEGVIAHGVNRQRAMGSGVAKSLYAKWPEVREQYLHKLPVPELGQVREVVINDNLSIYNCYTQENYGYDNEAYADICAIGEAMERIANKNVKEINIPKIGCGLGGLDWNNLEPILIEIELQYRVEFVVHTI